MKIGIVIPSHHRAVLGWRMLPLCYAGLWRQTYRDWRAFVVFDDGTPGDIHRDAIRDSLDVAKQLDIDQNPERIQHITSSFPLWNKRNLGLDLAAQAGCDVIVQMDDDDIYCERYLELLAEHYSSHPECPLINVQRVNCYHVGRRMRGVDGQNGAALHSCRASVASRYRYGQWRWHAYGEDTVYNIHVAADKVLEGHRTSPDPVGDQVIVMRYQAGHTWNWNGSHVLRTPDPDGQWLASKIGETLARKYLSIHDYAPSAGRHVSKCGKRACKKHRWGFSICQADRTISSLQDAVSAGRLVRSMASCPLGYWGSARSSGAVEITDGILIESRRKACRRCEQYGADLAACNVLCTTGCKSKWDKAIKTGMFPGFGGCIQGPGATDSGRVVFAGFVPPGGATRDVEINVPLAGIAGRTLLRWCGADRVQPEPGDWFISGNRWHSTPGTPGLRRADWIYESIGHWGSEDRYWEVYSKPIGEIQFVANPMYAGHRGNVYLPNYGYYEWQASQRPTNSGERLCVAVIANTGLYGIEEDKGQISRAIAAGGEAGEVELLGKAFGRPVPGYWWDTPPAYARGRFAIVLENVHHAEFSVGYLSEKLYMAALGGAVPCYLGAWNIEQLVPDGCYVDLRPFVGRWADVVPHLRGLDVSAYRSRIEDWIASEEFKARSFERTCIEIDKAIWQSMQTM